MLFYRQIFNLSKQILFPQIISSPVHYFSNYLHSFQIPLISQTSCAPLIEIHYFPNTKEHCFKNFHLQITIRGECLPGPSYNSPLRCHARSGARGWGKCWSSRADFYFHRRAAVNARREVKAREGRYLLTWHEVKSHLVEEGRKTRVCVHIYIYIYRRGQTG